jgi:hypothetical protein
MESIEALYEYEKIEKRLEEKASVVPYVARTRRDDDGMEMRGMEVEFRWVRRRLWVCALADFILRSPQECHAALRFVERACFGQRLVQNFAGSTRVGALRPAAVLL